MEPFPTDDERESLAALVQRRQAELGYGSLIALYRAAGLGPDSISYETLRRIAKGEQRSSRASGTTVSDVARILRVDENTIRTAEAVGEPVGGWDRYERLTDSERAAVEAIIDALLAAHDDCGVSHPR